MKIIKYKLLQGADGASIDKVLSFSEANEEIAKAEACDGVYTIEEIVEPATAPAQLDRIEAQVTYTAMMTDTLLEV